MADQKHYFSNKQIGQILRQIAAALEVKGEDRFRIRAYQRAAIALEHATSEAKDLWDDGKLTDLAGVGSSIAKYLDELFKTGKVSHFEEIKKGLPEAGFVFLNIPGIGPKTAFLLSEKLKIKTGKGAIQKLRAAAKQGKISTIEGFGKKSESEILANLKRNKKNSSEERMLLPYASVLAESIIDFLSTKKAVLQINALGSLRRKVVTVGDIDLAVAAKDSTKVIEKLKEYPQVKKILAAGSDVARFVLQSGRQVDLKIVAPESYGALLQHYTGSKEHNIHLREIAKNRGLSLSEHGIKFNGKLKKYKTEKEFYQALNMAYIPAELRENRGEIEAATREFQRKSNGLPKLVEKNDIKGDLHIHSSFAIEPSHDLGSGSFEEILKQAKSLGYEYIGFSEHNPSLSQHNQNQVLSLIKKKKQTIDEINYSRGKKLSINILNGLEIDIKKNGELALPQKALDYLDYAIAAIHSSFNLSRREMTDRIIRGLSHPKVKFLAHPTTRKLGEREGIEIDWDRLFAFCKKESKFLEISSQPQRLDLPDFLVKEAVANGVKMIINSDSHAIKHMELMPYGVSVARRGWAQKNDILNTLKWFDFKKIF